MKKIVLNSFAVLAGVALGAITGILVFSPQVFETMFDTRPTSVRYFTWIAMGWGVSEHAFEENSKDAEHLLKGHLTFIENGMDPRSNLDPAMKKALLLHAALTKARLSILENQAGNADQAASYMSAAQGDLKSLGWRDVSEANILTFARTLPTVKSVTPPSKLPRSNPTFASPVKPIS